MDRALLKAALRVLRTAYSGNQPSLADIELLRASASPNEGDLDLHALANAIIWREIRSTPVPTANPISPPTGRVRAARLAASLERSRARLARRGLSPHYSEELTELPRGKNVAEASLGGAPLVPVMKSAELRYRNNGSVFR
jgi:hypothetical protein